MTQERIDLTQFEEMDVTSMPIWYSKIPDLAAELKRCYEEIDYLVDMLHKLGYYGKNISEEKQLEWEEASE